MYSAVIVATSIVVRTQIARPASTAIVTTCATVAPESLESESDEESCAAAPVLVVGDADGDDVGDVLGELEGDAEGDVDGDALGEVVGLVVGFDVGLVVGLVDGDAVGGSTQLPAPAALICSPEQLVQLVARSSAVLSANVPGKQIPQCGRPGACE